MPIIIGIVALDVGPLLYREHISWALLIRVRLLILIQRTYIRHVSQFIGIRFTKNQKAKQNQHVARRAAKHVCLMRTVS